MRNHLEDILERKKREKGLSYLKLCVYVCMCVCVYVCISVSQKMKVLRYDWPTDFKFLLDEELLQYFSPAPEKPGKYFKTPFRRWRSVYIHLSGEAGEAGEV